MIRFGYFGAVVLLAALAGCSETSSSSAPPAMADAAPMRSGSAQDENACLSAVRSQTGNTVTVLSSEFSQANTEVIIGVGPQRAKWRCLVSRGRVAEVMSLTNEGAM